jgi:predicted amidohydrolase
MGSALLILGVTVGRGADMTSTMTTIGMAQWLPTCGQPGHNLEMALELIERLAERGSDVVTLPELWPSGYDPETLAVDARRAAEPLDGPRGAALAGAARQHALWLFAGSVPELDGDRLYNTSVVYAPDGTLRAAHRKVHLYLPLGEDDVFEAGTGPTVVEVDGIGTVGLSTCFDGDHPTYARALQRLGARVVVSASAYEVAAESWWDLLYPANALANGQWWVMTNQCGGAGPTALLGKSRIVAPDGSTTAQASRVGEGDGDSDPELVVVSVDLAAGIEEADRTSAALWSESTSSRG